ncbi:MAG: DUF1232 domain-containing protein [Candidatus Hydrogenedentes bacterium]|nr:DUF1232 domain-containing protein [Candidatus Hydrogenedentota bacterium]
MGTGEQANVPDEKALLKVVDRSTALATRVAQDPGQTEKLIRSAERKAARNENAIRQVYKYVVSFSRLLRAYARREYTVVPWGSIILITIALIYFVSPIDLIPDFVLGGFIDDVALIASIVKQVQSDLDAFRAWETRDLSEEA